ncbi:MAG TPA: hypothetical protein VK745_16815 [Polyangiaceae bacterium]|nr:hypothetical protein [Polyangiaceae bacterium]
MTNENQPPDEESAVLETPQQEPPSGSRFGMSLLGRAKTAKEQAQSSVTGLASRATGAAATTADDLKGHVTAKANELKDASLAKLAEMLDDFNASLPVIREAGYTLSGVDIGIGLPPKVTASFLVSSEVSPETFERLMAEHAQRKFTLLLLKSLHHAWQLHTKIKIVGLKPRGLSVDLGLIPVVSVKFS